MAVARDVGQLVVPRKFGLCSGITLMLSGVHFRECVYEVVSRNRDLKETTIRTLLRRLEQKGYLQHDSEGRAYVYRATERPRSLAARAVRQIIDRFCQGSVEELVSGMVDAKMLSKSEMSRLEEFVRNQKKKGK